MLGKGEKIDLGSRKTAAIRLNALVLKFIKQKKKIVCKCNKCGHGKDYLPSHNPSNCNIKVFSKLLKGLHISTLPHFIKDLKKYQTYARFPYLRRS